MCPSRDKVGRNSARATHSQFIPERESHLEFGFGLWVMQRHYQHLDHSESSRCLLVHVVGGAAVVVIAVVATDVVVVVAAGVVAASTAAALVAATVGCSS